MGAGAGYTVNVPWNGSGVGDADMLAAFAAVVLPVAAEFRPDLMIVSAGFDAVAGDPLGGCRVSPAAFGHLTALLSAVAPSVLLLEGGYNLTATAAATEACLRVLLGEAPAPLEGGQAGALGGGLVLEGVSDRALESIRGALQVGGAHRGCARGSMFACERAPAPASAAVGVPPGARVAGKRCCGTQRGSLAERAVRVRAACGCAQVQGRFWGLLAEPAARVEAEWEARRQAHQAAAAAEAAARASPAPCAPGWGWYHGSAASPAHAGPLCASSPHLHTAAGDSPAHSGPAPAAHHDVPAASPPPPSPPPPVFGLHAGAGGGDWPCVHEVVGSGPGAGMGLYGEASCGPADSLDARRQAGASESHMDFCVEGGDARLY